MSASVEVLFTKICWTSSILPTYSKRELIGLVHSQVLEALRAQRNRGETSDDEPGGQTENSASKKAQQINATDKDVLQSEAAKHAARVIQEGESAVHAKLNNLYRFKLYPHCLQSMGSSYIQGGPRPKQSQFMLA